MSWATRGRFRALALKSWKTRRESEVCWSRIPAGVAFRSVLKTLPLLRPVIVVGNTPAKTVEAKSGLGPRAGGRFRSAVAGHGAGLGERHAGFQPQDQQQVALRGGLLVDQQQVIVDVARVTVQVAK